ncbi:MAG TPA: gamma carbonic anhydrase family protein [Dehalococcoidia bacterium]|nr:gamma carbonic anhydrase family protein [Dehalococcoidia bacterium]
MIRSLGDRTPVIHPTAFVSEFAYVVGDVEIGEGSSVWPGAVIRGESKIVIGRFTCIQDNTTIHAERRGAKIGDYVVMGHNVMCHAAVIEDGAALGNGAIVNSDAEIGAYSVIASGAVVLDGKKVPARTLMIGVPAVAKGEVPEQHAERFRWTAEHYAELGAEYKAAGLE